MTLRETLKQALQSINPLRVGRVERLRRETVDRQMQALRKVASDRLVAVNASSSLNDELREEIVVLKGELRKTKSRLVALKGLLVKLGTDQLDSNGPSIH